MKIYTCFFILFLKITSNLASDVILPPSIHDRHEYEYVISRLEEISGSASQNGYGPVLFSSFRSHVSHPDPLALLAAYNIDDEKFYIFIYDFSEKKIIANRSVELDSLNAIRNYFRITLDNQSRLRKPYEKYGISSFYFTSFFEHRHYDFFARRNVENENSNTLFELRNILVHYVNNEITNDDFVESLIDLGVINKE